MTLRTRTLLSTLAGGAVALVLLASFTRLGLPLPLTLILASIGCLAAAIVTSAMDAASLSRRVHGIEATAARYARGDLSPAPRDYGEDEVGQVARMLDDSVQALGRRLEESARGRAHMEAILSGMFESVILVSGSGRVLLANAAARELLTPTEGSAPQSAQRTERGVGAPRVSEPGGVQGSPPLEIEGRHYLEIIRQPDVAALVSSALGGEAGDQVEVTLGRDPRRVFTARSTPVAGPQGSPSTSLGAGGAVLVLHDITALQRANQIRRDFVANVSHELRTPLTAVRGYVEALLDAPPDISEQRRFLEIIARHTLRMERLVGDLLRLARLDAGQEELEIAEITVEGLMSGIETELEPAIAARRMQVNVVVGANARSISGDPGKLHDALRNLVENAVHYGAEGTAVDIDVSRDADDILIAIADRGPGVPPSDLDRIFERFYRVDRARTRSPGGTGLGLAIVKHLIGLHGGSVRAANREGGGALFVVRLPQRRRGDPVTDRAEAG